MIPGLPRSLPLRAPTRWTGLAREGWPWSDLRSAERPPYRERTQDWPRISVVTPSFNQGDYLEAAMRSVLLQGYPNLEYLVLDGGSTDQSLAVIEHYEPHLFHWQSGSDGGQADAIARGLELASGEVLCWLNSDDLLLPGALWHVAKLFRQRASIHFVYGNRLTIDADGIVTGRHVWPRRLTRWHWALGQPLAQECSFWSRELYDRVGGLDRERFFTLDHDLFYRMWRAEKFFKTSAVLGCLRVHGETKNALHQDVRERELAQTRIAYGLRVPGPLLARVINHLDRRQFAREERALAPLRAGVSVDEACRGMRGELSRR